jgi:ribosomal protein S18 acetylase RimI-like enzyme
MAAFNEAEAIAWRPDTMLPALRRLLGEPALGLGVVAEDPTTATLVGYALGTFGYDLEFAGADAFVTELYVEPAFRARGLGRALLESVVEEIARAGANAVHLMVRPENRRARALYEQSGFRDVPRLLMT